MGDPAWHYVFPMTLVSTGEVDAPARPDLDSAWKLKRWGLHDDN